METAQGSRKNSSERQPLVSVCMPVHNAAGTLKRAVDSVRMQDVPLELILVDDASCDESRSLMEELSRESFIRYVRNETNVGAAASRNRAVSMAQAPYVAFLDADDEWAPGKLKKQLERVRATGACLCCTGREIMTPQGLRTGRVIPAPEQISYRKLLRSNVINCSSVLLKTELAKQYPMEHEDSHEDYITWLKILRDHGDACGLPEPLLYYRQSSKGKSGSRLKSAGMTFRVYRYMQFGMIKSCCCFACYALNGVGKYAASYLHRRHS